jgi:cytochrome b involved in lipid metabolism
MVCQNCVFFLHPKIPSKLRSNPLPNFTMAQVAQHNTKDDCWIILNERVYDITCSIDRHPGGVGPVVAGKDATDVFANYHAAKVYATMLSQWFLVSYQHLLFYPLMALGR